MSHQVETKPLHQPTLGEVCAVWKDKLSLNFKDVDVEVVECPDLRVKEWGLAAPGLCGHPKVGEVGGVGYLMPVFRGDKYYGFEETLRAAEITDGLLLGAGAGPYKHVGRNSELILNARLGAEPLNKSKVATVREGGVKLDKLPQCECNFGLLLNFFVCEGKPGNVIRVSAKKRTGEKDFVGCLRTALTDHYGDKSVGFGGTFRINQGSVKVHVMPDFSKTPLDTDEKIDKWLTFHKIDAPIVFMSVALSKDPGVNFRLEHTHGAGPDSGGHYHYDVTPDTISYEGYFNIAEEVVRVDKP